LVGGIRIYVTIILLIASLYVLNFLSLDKIQQMMRFYFIYLFFPFLFLGIIGITSSYLLRIILGLTSSDNVTLLVLSIFFLILFSFVSWAYYKVILRSKNK